MLGNLLLEKMRNKGLSARAVARECDIAHTTVNRILSGKPVDLDTLETVCNWLEIDVTAILGKSEDNLANQISSLLRMEPELASVFGKAIEGMADGTYSRRDIQDIVAYAAFRLDPRSMSIENQITNERD